MLVEVVKEFEYADTRGNKKTVKPGELVDVLTIADEKRLRSQGKIRDRKTRPVMNRSVIPPAPSVISILDSGYRDNPRPMLGSYRVLKKFRWHDQRGTKFEAKPGELIDVLAHKDCDSLMALGLIGPKSNSHNAGLRYGQAAAPFATTTRIGIWMITSTQYSGGRIHMYQYAWCLAKLGAEVWIVTNAIPAWQIDYPPLKRLHISIWGKDTIPPDLDLIVTDSKSSMGENAVKWCEKHKRIPFVCFNFETPNWVAKYVPDYAKRLQLPKEVFQKADYLLANSELSRQHLMEWVNKDTPSGVLNPAVNTFALEGKAPDDKSYKRPAHPYAVYSARSAGYKCGQMVAETIWKMDEPFDLAVFGILNRAPKDTPKHKLYAYQNKSDAIKYAIMRKAVVALAPSLFEGYGMVPGEAMAVGTPCIVYDLPVLREAYGTTPEYVKWDDKNAFRKALQDLVKSPKRLPDSTARKVQETKGMDAMLKKIERLHFHSVQKKTISAHMICYWGFLPESIESIYPYVDELRIAYGPTELNSKIPADGSLDLLQAVPDPDKKIILEVRDVWRNKMEMREWGTNKIFGNRHLLLDGDEVWVGLDKWIEEDINFSSPRWVNFWHDVKHWVYDTPKLAGLRWGKKLEPRGSVCPHYRWSYWRNSYKWIKHPVVADANGKALHNPAKVTAEMVPECIIYHFGHCLPQKTMRTKHEFYRRRDGNDAGRKKREHVWHDWKGEIGDCGDGRVAVMDWELPEIVKRAAERIRKCQK